MIANRDYLRTTRISTGFSLPLILLLAVNQIAAHRLIFENVLLPRDLCAEYTLNKVQFQKTELAILCREIVDGTILVEQKEIAIRQSVPFAHVASVSKVFAQSFYSFFKWQCMQSCTQILNEPIVG